MGQMMDVLLLGGFAVAVIYISQNPDILNSLKMPTAEAAPEGEGEGEEGGGEEGGEEEGGGGGGDEEEGGGGDEEEEGGGDEEEEEKGGKKDKKKDKDEEEEEDEDSGYARRVMYVRKANATRKSYTGNVQMKRISTPYTMNMIPTQLRTYRTTRVLTL